VHVSVRFFKEFPVQNEKMFSINSTGRTSVN
jgi:hypothetical protein